MLRQPLHHHLPPRENLMLNSEYFTLSEFAKSPTAIRKGIDNTIPPVCYIALQALVDHVLTPIRQHFGPVVINSGYRCPKLNTLVGGAKGSQHVYSSIDAAADIEVPGVANGLLYSWVKSNLEYDQLILEHHDINDATSGWVHVSYSLAGNRMQAFSIGGNND